MTTPFFQLQLRTLGVDTASAFYRAVLGEQALQVFQLHEQAVARGAQPHWLGSIEVADLDAALASFSARGAQALGPKWTNPEGLEGVVMRDPGGAVVGLVKPSAQSRETAKRLGPDLVSSVLNTQDVENVKRNYGALAGWAFAEPVDLGPLGVSHPFSTEPGGNTVGVMIDIAGRPRVHPHWLFQFRVSDLDAAATAVQASGGLVADRLTLPSGDRIAVCDDPQGAAFALCEQAAR